MKTLLESRNITILLLACIVLSVFYPTLFAPLNSVDDSGMCTYLLNADGISLRSIFFPGGSGAYYRPLLVTTFLFDKYAWGFLESFMHLQNIVLHLCNTLLIFAISRRSAVLLNIKSPFPAFLAALFFAIHPINTEAVNWISGRTDLLAGFFILISAFLLLKTTTSLANSILSALCLLLACLSKETAIFFLPAVLLAPFFVSTASEKKPPLHETLRKNAVHFSVIFATGTAYFVFRAIAFSQGDSGVAKVLTNVAGENSAGLFDSLQVVLKAAGFYLKKLIIPFPLNFGIIHVSDLYMILGAFLPVGLVWILTRRTLSSFFFLASASVGSSALLIPLLKVAWTPLAERYMYIPSAFFLLGVVFVIYGWRERMPSRRIITGAVVSLVVVASFFTVRRNFLWQDNLALFQDTVRKSPDFLPAQNQYAQALYARGRQAEAIALLNSLNVPKSVINFQYGMVNKATARAYEGDYAGARKILRKTLNNPGKHEVMIIQRLLKLNELEIDKGTAEKGSFYEENVALLTRLHQITGDPFICYRLGQTHLFAGNRAKARESFQQVVANASDKVYYRQAAEKLLVKLSK